MRPYGPLVLRLALGAVFVAHGAQKLFGVWGGGGPTGTAAFFQAQGLSPALLLALLVGLVETAGGLLIMAGAYSAPAAAALAVIQAVAIWKVHRPHGFFLNWTGAPGVGHGFEFNVVLVAGLVCLMLTGPGALAVDIRRLRTGPPPAAPPASPPERV
jgi:putative oxidoreductase